MANKTYIELLRDTRWQRKRLEIFTRDGWACTFCSSTTKTLHVHHRRYIRGRMPWEYDSSDLVTLCEEHHETTTKLMNTLKEQAGRLSLNNLSALVGFAAGLEMAGCLFSEARPMPIGMPTEIVNSAADTVGFGLALGVTHLEQFKLALSDGGLTLDRLIARAEELAQEEGDYLFEQGKKWASETYPREGNGEE